MTLQFHWFLPTSGDGRAITGRGHSIPLASLADRPGDGQNAATHITGAAAQERPPDIDYLAQIALPRTGPVPQPGAGRPHYHGPLTREPIRIRAGRVPAHVTFGSPDDT